MKKITQFTILSSLLFTLGACGDKLVLEPESAQQPAPIKVGDSYGGGIVFYVNSTGQHGLTAATSDQTGGSGSIPIPDLSSVSNSIVVSGVSAPAMNLVSVQINLTHTYVGDLSISLQCPSGTVIDLSSGNGTSGDNYTNTVFTASAGTPITSGAAPFTGSYLPEQPFSNFSFSPSNGTWTLTVTDGASGDVGTLLGWSLQFSTGTFSYPSTTGIRWNNGSSFATGATGTTNGTGYSNTNTIVGAQGLGSYAAQLCDQLTLNGYTDWYLPSQDELTLLYNQRSIVGGFASSYYWSSSEITAANAILLDFSIGTVYQDTKASLYRVRAIRSF